MAVAVLARPNGMGLFGRFGSKYVPETLRHALTELEATFHALATDHVFQVSILVGRCLFFSILQRRSWVAKDKAFDDEKRSYLPKVADDQKLLRERIQHLVLKLVLKE